MEIMDYILVALLLIIIIQIIYLTARMSMNRPLLKAKPVFIDTSALMDGRIITAAATGFIGSRLVVPKSVLAELQLLADTGDSEKRSRARHGLDAVSELKALPTTSVEIMDDGAIGDGGVDARLIELAKRHNGMICTIDFNLNKVAKAETIFVLNINELAQSLRMAFLPGERVSLQLTQKGQDSHQAVGYLADGTMVVVEHAAKLIGTSTEIEFIRTIQTAAGRMLFAKLVNPVQATSSRERQPQAKGRMPKTATAKQSNTHKQPAKRRTQANREDSLIELVNKQ